MARSFPASVYLTAYNFAQAYGWSLVLYQIVRQIAQNHSIHGTFDAVGESVRLLQLASFLEVLHAVLGIVPSGVFPSLLQWGGRYHWIAAIVCKLEEVQRLPSVFITLACWSVSEVIRYPQYGLSIFGICPQWLTWLRYTAFILLYPLGALAGEVLLLYEALPYAKKKNLYGKTFDKLPFNYYSFLVVVTSIYPVLWFGLYLHMFRQRQNKLGKFSGVRGRSVGKKSQ